GTGESTSGPGGSVEIIATGPERLEVAVDAVGPGVLVIQRAYLPLYRATVDGEETPIRIANMHRMGIELPAGSHAVSCGSIGDHWPRPVVCPCWRRSVWAGSGGGARCYDLDSLE
ncbi:MAG: hypothetical protein WBG64_09760, partial [Thermoanaerobaculia bacterium]